MGFRPDPQQTEAPAVGRFRPDAAPVKLGPSPAAVDAPNILGNDRMQELSANPVAPLKGAAPLDATAEDRVQAGASGINEGAAGLAGLPMDTMLNIWDLGKAAIGTLQGEMTGGPPSDMFDPADRSGVPLSGQWNADRLNDIGVETQARRPDDTASRYIHAGATGVPGALAGGGGVANTVRQVAAGVAPGVAYEGVGDLGGSQGQQSLIANALGIAGGHAASIPAKGPKAPADPITAEKRQVAQDIRSNNIKLTPKEHSKLTGDKNYGGRLLQAIGGDTKVSGDMATVNQSVINDIGRKAVGANTLTEKGLKPVKDTGNAVYSEMSKLGAVSPTPELSAAIEKARGSAAKSTERNVDIDKLVDATLSQIGGSGPSNLTSDQIVTKVRELRRDSQNNFKGEGEKRPTVQKEALGGAQRQIADALDDFLEYHAATAGKPELAEKYKANRVRLAKVGTVEQATEAGNLNAKQLKDAKQKGAGLTGKLGDLATANEFAPQSTAPNANEALLDAPGRNLDILELPVAALQNLARHVGVNKILQSDWYQNKLGQGGAQHQYDYDPNPDAFPARAPEPTPEPAPPAPPSIDFAGELGLAPDSGPRDALPGGNRLAQPDRVLAPLEELAGPFESLDLAENAATGPLGKGGRRSDPNAIDFEEALGTTGPYQPFKGGVEYSQSLNPRTEHPRIGNSVNEADDLSIAPDAPTGPQDQMPPKPRGKPRQGGAPREPKPRPATAAPAAPAEAPADVQSLGALIDEMLSASTRNRNRQQTMEQPAQQQQAQAQAQGVVPGTNFAGALGIADDVDHFPDRYKTPTAKRISESPEEGYIAYEPKDGRRQINDAYVKDEARGKGLGQKNLVKAAKEAEAAGEALDSDVSITPAQARAYLSAQKKGLIDFEIADQKAWDEALAAGTNIKAGGQPVVKNIKALKPTLARRLQNTRDEGEKAIAKASHDIDEKHKK